MQLREVLFQIRIVWSSAQESCIELRGENFGKRENFSYDPWHLMMKLDRPDIVQVSMQSEETTAVLRPDIYGTSGLSTSSLPKYAYPRL